MKKTALKRTSSETPDSAQKSARLPIQKTYKLYIGGEFPRSESGRSYPVHDSDKQLLAHAARATRKDLRNAVLKARSAQSGWEERTAYNRGQILYRVAEIMENRAEALTEEVKRSGGSADEVYMSIDRWVWYAGWADKYATVLGGANPVAGPYFNFSIPEPMGVIGIVAPEEYPLLGLVSRLAPALVSGNSCLVLASEDKPLPAATLGEVLATSDVPSGVVNILTGYKGELVEHLVSHADVNGVDISGCSSEMAAEVEGLAADSVTRVLKGAGDPVSETAQSPYIITDFCEVKTVWHPIGK